MVLTAEELAMAADTGKKDFRIYSALFTRKTTSNFSEQAACDREIQRYLGHKLTIAYKFNCFIVHQPWKFKQFAPFIDHGWENDGPTNEKLMSIYRSSPIYSRNLETGNEQPKLNDLSNKGAEAIEKIIFIEDKSSKLEYGKPPEYADLRRNAAKYREDGTNRPGCFADLLSCLFL